MKDPNGEQRSSVFSARLRFWFLTGTLIGVALAALLIAGLTQTDRGRATVLAFSLDQASRIFDGTLEVQRLDGNILTGARLYGIVLRGPDDRRFLAADSAFVEYSLRTITGDEIVLDRLILYGADVDLRLLPGDTLWNFDKIFGDTIEVESPSPRSPIVVRAAELVDARIFVEMPWEPDPGLSATEQQTEIEAALADTSRILVSQVPGGFVQRYEFHEVDAEVLRLVSAPDELGGTSLRIERFAGLIRVFRDPVRIVRMSGDVRFHMSVLEFRMPVLNLPESRFAGYGAIELGAEDGPRLDLTVRGDTVAFRDLAWLYPYFPDDGGGSLELVIESRTDGTLYLARELDVAAPGTRLVGSFGLVLNDVARFVDVNLSADPLRVATIEAMLPEDLPVVGLRIGAVEIRQPRS